MLRKEILDLDFGYAVDIYNDNELIIHQEFDIETGGRITTSERANQIADVLLNELQQANSSEKLNAYNTLAELTYNYVISQYPDEKQKSDMVDEKFWSSFLIKKLNLTATEIYSRVYDYVASIKEGQATFTDIISSLPTTVHTFGVEPFETEFKDINYNPDTGYILNHQNIVPTSLNGYIDYAGNLKPIKDDSNGNIIDGDNNDVIGTIDYNTGIITFDSTKLDITLINSIDIRFRKYFLIPESYAWEQLIKVGVRIAFVQDVKFRYNYLKDMISNMDEYQLNNLNLQELIEQYYPKLELV